VIGAMLLAVAAAVLAAAGIVELAAGFGRAPRNRAADRRERVGERAPSRLARVLARLGRRLGAPAAPADLGRRLDAAGMPPGAGVAEVMALKCGASAAAVLACLPLAAILPARLGIVAVAAAPAAAFVAPDTWLTRRARRRRAAMAAELADVLDLLGVAVAAGLTPLRALGEVGRRRSGPLAAELRAAATRAALGVPHAHVLDLLERRCPLEGIAALAAAVGRAQRHGAPLGPSLCALAADARAERAQRLRERSARAAPKIQLIVALLLVPAVMLLVGAGLAASFV
jgi:tight adherence protein C